MALISDTNFPDASRTGDSAAKRLPLFGRDLTGLNSVSDDYSAPAFAG
jgi:hypothetical protein